MRLVLVRHGQGKDQLTETNSGERTCSGLTDLGREQVHALATHLRESGEFSDCQTLLSSTIARARQTAKILLDVLPAQCITEDSDLCELRMGQAEGLTTSEIQAKYGDSTPPGAETFQELFDRAHSTLLSYSQRFNGQTVIAVTHGGFIVGSTIRLFSGPETKIWLHPLNTGITEWSLSDGIWTLVQYNNAYHLHRLNESC